MKTILFSFIFCLIHVCLTAQPGTLDGSFGIDGKVLTSFGVSEYPTFYKGILQTDDKIIEVGNIDDGFLAVRYTADGVLDSSFGENGQKIINFPFESHSEARFVAKQNNGKIIISGYGFYGFTFPVYSGLIVRLNTNGSVDSSFGINGVIRIKPNGNAGAIAVLPDDKIIAVASSGKSVFINRYLENGILDESFGKNGYTYLTDTAIATTCKIQSDGKIVLGGFYYLSHANSAFWIQRFSSEGEVDSAFGKNGTVITIYGINGSEINELAFQSNGKIVATGETGVNSSEDHSYFATARYNYDGTLDTTFGTGGEATVIFKDTSAIANSIAIAKDDKIIIAGFKRKGNTFFYDDYALARLKPNGILDSTFGDYGKVTTDFGLADHINSVCLQKGNKIVAMGLSYSSINDCSLARYNNDSTRRQIIISKIKHYISTHNNADAATSSKNITLYPNPVQNLLTIKGLSAINNYQLIINNSKGSVVATKQVNNISTYQFNVQDLSSGVFYINVVANNSIVATLKFVKE
jgi:uncharacterized delta-60 repeat protein